MNGVDWLLLAAVVAIACVAAKSIRWPDGEEETSMTIQQQLDGIRKAQLELVAETKLIFAAQTETASQLKRIADSLEKIAGSEDPSESVTGIGTQINPPIDRP